MSSAEKVDVWIRGYVNAWNTNGAADIESLFTATASYSPAPYTQPWQGRQQIVEQWLAHRDQPGQTEFHWRLLILADDMAVVTGTTRYPNTTYSNLWLIRLTDDGRCEQFSEWWMEHPRAGN
jgi:hypothetical protein